MSTWILMIPFPKVVPFLKNGWTLFCIAASVWGYFFFSDITIKPLMVITLNKTKKSVLPIFYNLCANMQPTLTYINLL